MIKKNSSLDDVVVFQAETNSPVFCFEAGEQFMQPGPNSGMGEQYNRGPPGPMGNMQMGQRQQYPYVYDRR